MNLGLIAFLGALLSAQTQLEAFTAPIMGVSILIGIAVSLIRLGAREGPALRVAQAVR